MWENNPNALIPWFLMTSWLYYHRDISIISDTLYDWMCKELLVRWDTLEHRHKHLIDKGMLEAGTGFNLREDDYPGITIGAASLRARSLGYT